MATMPSLFIPHGGGPCFFMADPERHWTAMAAFLRGLPALLPATPKAILVVSGHWETSGFALTSAAAPKLLYDYHGFPADTYQLRYDAPGDPALAARAAALMEAAGLAARLDPERDLDHGVFVPLKLVFPDADVPVVELSVEAGLDPATHLAAGRVLAPLRQEGVLILATGMSFHNMRAYNNPAFTAPSDQFDAWLEQSVTQGGAARAARLREWETAPAARLSHPDAEHLLPLMVAAGASDAAGERIFGAHVVQVKISGFRFA